MRMGMRELCRGYQQACRMVFPMLPFRQPELLPDLQAIPALLGSKKISAVLLLTGRTVGRHPLVQELKEALTAAGIRWTNYDGTVPNPTIRNIEEAVALYYAAGAQAIVAVGGGSVLDCGKVAGARIACPGREVREMRGMLKIRRTTPLTVAVPTTAGSGSEATLAAVVTDSKTHEKYPITDFALIPDYAVLEPRLTAGLPPAMTVSTGMDALTHAVEAYIGQSTTQKTRALSERAVAAIVRSLPRAAADGGDLDARRRLLRASFQAGVAFSRSFVGYVHAAAHALGGQYNIAHGVANAVLLPYFLEAYGAAVEGKLARLARLSGLSGREGERAAAAAMIRWIREQNRAAGIPEQIAGVPRSDLPELARRADREANPLYPVPVELDRWELEAVLQRATRA